jgi:hypothetical protein
VRVTSVRVSESVDSAFTSQADPVTGQGQVRSRLAVGERVLSAHRQSLSAYRQCQGQPPTRHTFFLRW